MARALLLESSPSLLLLRSFLTSGVSNYNADQIPPLRVQHAIQLIVVPSTHREERAEADITDEVDLAKGSKKM